MSDERSTSPVSGRHGTDKAVGDIPHQTQGSPRSSDAAALATLARPERREDGVGKVSGRTRYAGDRTLPGTLWAAFLSSQVPHGRIRSVDTSAARAMPGVQAVLTGADVAGVLFGRQLFDRPVLAWDRVRFVGDRLAAVAADSLEAAEAAAAAIEIDIEELEPVFDVESALADGAPILHPEAAKYVYLAGTRPAVPHPNVQGRLLVQRGEEDIEAVFARAARVFASEYSTPRQHHGYIEPHATLVWIDHGGVVHVVTTNKAPFRLRAQMARSLGLEPAQIEIDADVIGGDFGGKGYSIDEFACYFLARVTGRPVRSVTRYADELAAVNVRHAARMRLRTAVDVEGRLLAHDADILFDGGAYASAKPMPHLVPGGGAPTLAPYRIPNVRIDVRTVYTNTVPAGHMRAPGEVQALFAGESHIDALARELGEDPLEFRLRNVARDGEVGALGDRFKEARGADVLEHASFAIGWGHPLAPGRGRGIALGVHHVGGRGVGVLALTLRLKADGRIDVLSGSPDQGSGQATVIRRVLAATASIDESRISVVRRTTADAPVNPGVGGSWGTHLASRAAENLGLRLRAWIDERLPGALPDPPAGAELRGDALIDPATGRIVLGFDELVRRLVPSEAPVELNGEYDAGIHGPDEPGDNNFVACAVEVSVDPDTGTIAILDAVVAADVGTIINPIAHAGQIDGAFAFGVGAALMEELIVEGGVLVGRTLGEVRLPTIRDVPPLRKVLIPTLVGPGAFGAKAAGELSNAPVAPAIANAVAAAVGIRPTALPMTPERVLVAIRAKNLADPTLKPRA